MNINQISSNLYQWLVPEDGSSTAEIQVKFDASPIPLDIDDFEEALLDETEEKIENYFFQIKDRLINDAFRKNHTCKNLISTLFIYKENLISRINPRHPDAEETACRINEHWEITRKIIRKINREASYRADYIKQTNKVIRKQNRLKATRTPARKILDGVVAKLNVFQFAMHDRPTLLVPLALMVNYAFAKIRDNDPQKNDSLEPSAQWVAKGISITGAYLLSIIIVKITEVALHKLDIRDQGPEAYTLPTSVQERLDNRRKGFCRKISRTIQSITKEELSEEIRYRVIIQGALTLLAMRSGIETSYAHFYAKMTASVIFGVDHASQYLSKAMMASISGFFVYGKLYQDYGFVASTLMHVLHNRVVSVACAKLLSK